MKLLNNISRIVVGIVFVFSGFVKAVDPLGSTYKFIDYFDAFSMEFLSFMALPLAIILSSLEFVIGFSLLFGTFKKITSWLLMLFRSFFTILTFILAIYNPVSDCGCFGDAIIMTNWQTFWKNVFLMIFTIILFYSRNKFEVNWHTKKQYIFISLPSAFSVLLSVYCFYNLPIIDFRPYNVGTYIPEKMIIPEDAPKAQYETVITYEKDGVQKDFDLQSLPDSTWKWVATKNTLVSEGYVPPIHDFTIETLDGNDITKTVLNDNKFTFVLIAHDITKTNISNMDHINNLAKMVIDSGNNFICLTSSVGHEIKEFNDRSGAKFQYYNTDEITLKTIVRSNPGLILIKKGKILGKWHNRNIPDFNQISKEFLDNDHFKNNDSSDEMMAHIN